MQPCTSLVHNAHPMPSMCHRQVTFAPLFDLEHLGANVAFFYFAVFAFRCYGAVMPLW